MSVSVCPFGGVPGAPAQNLRAIPNPPARGFRLISGFVWWRLVHLQWQQFLAAQAVGETVTPPTLGRLGATGVFFTDLASLQGLIHPGDFAARLNLPRQVTYECQLYGCAVIEFPVPPGSTLTKQGLTPGGGREWITDGNVYLSRDMIATIIRTNGYFDLPLYP